MCGISGFIDTRHESTVEMLEAMNRTMIHRGPDGEGYFMDNFSSAQVGLAHRRLSIIDLSSHAGQPMHYEHFSIVFNGEIYNYKEIRLELESLGHHNWLTESDTEVVLHAYAQWGIKAVDRFVGMFALVVLDRKKGKVICIRDRAGVKPFYYYHHEGLFLFASELKAFHQHPRFQKTIDQGALALFFRYGYIPVPHCIFEHTFKLEPGTYLEWTLEGASLQKHTYWDINELYRQPLLNLSEQEAIKETEAVLKKAFEYRMVADVPVGVFLSGGYDSTAVAALLQSERSQTLKTFSIGFHELNYNEAPYAKQIADHLGTHHTEYYCTPEEAKEILPTLPFFFDEPFGDSSAIPTMLVSRLARKQVTVSLSADGGDELFGGYYRYPIIQKLDSVLSKVPLSIRKSIYHASGYVSPGSIPKLRNMPLVEQRYTKFRSLLMHRSPSDYLRSMSVIHDEETINQLMVHPSLPKNTFFDEEVNDNPILLHQLLARDYKTYMVDDILTKVDRATMSASLEGREPFLDHHIAAWVAQLDPKFKIRGQDKKYILKQIVHQYLPKEMMDRPKSGFAIPIDSWFKNDLAEYFEKYLSETHVSNQGILNSQLIQDWRKNYQMGKKQYIVPLWNVLMFQLWYEKWMK